ncbi:MAG: DUF3822 family protein [Flavobacteriales bacterium]|nr:DUF3822 family protein [Flavobacteriales bacterium]
METGSDNAEAPVFRETLHLIPDRADELLCLGLAVYLSVARSSVSLLTVDAKTLKALSFRSFDFPHCRDDAHWASTVSHVLGKMTTTDVVATVVDNVPCSIIPSDLFPTDDAQMTSLLNLEHGELRNLTRVMATLDVWDSQCLALVPTELLNVLPTQKVIPSLCCWVPSLLRSPSAHHVHVHVSDHDFCLAVLTGRDLLFYNAFEQYAPEDVLYFTMAALEQLAILHTEARLTLYGRVTDGDVLHGLFRRYIADVVFGDRPAEMTYGYSFKDLSGHQVPFILNAPICAS